MAKNPIAFIKRRMKPKLGSRADRTKFRRYRDRLLDSTPPDWENVVGTETQIDVTGMTDPIWIKIIGGEAYVSLNDAGPDDPVFAGYWEKLYLGSSEYITVTPYSNPVTVQIRDDYQSNTIGDPDGLIEVGGPPAGLGLENESGEYLENQSGEYLEAA